MFSTAQLLLYAQWSGYLAFFFAALAALGWLLKWGIRFRLVGASGFMLVLATGFFALSLGLYTRPTIPGAVRFSRVFDTSGTDVVIAVVPTITESELEATLRQASVDLYSMGRLSQGADKMTIRLRTVVHPKPGTSQLVYLGEVKRSLVSHEDNNPEITIYRDKFAQLPKPTALRIKS
jgi:hypothetical protein